MQRGAGGDILDREFRECCAALRAELVPALIDAMGRRVGQAQLNAGLLLLYLGDSKGTDGVIACLRSPDAQLRLQALVQLSLLPLRPPSPESPSWQEAPVPLDEERILPELAPYLAEPAAREGRIALDVLTKLNLPEAASLLRPFIAHPDRDSRVRALRWLAERGEDYGAMQAAEELLFTSPHSADDDRYDDVGNMIARTEMGVGYTQAWDAENRLSRVDYGSTSGTPDVYTFAYDSDGARVLQTAPGNYRTAYIGAGMYEETLTPTMAFNDTFDEGAWQWEEQSGDWDKSDWVDEAYQQYESKTSEATSLIAGAAYADVRVNATVYMGNEDDALAGVLLRDEAEGLTTAYFVGLRNDASELLCGICEKVDGTWTNRTPGATACMVRGESAYALEVRAVGGVQRQSLQVHGAQPGRLAR